MSPKSVIVKAYSDKPVRLTAVEIVGESIMVAGENRERTIGFPRDLVFEFDRTLYAKLSSAYEAGDQTATRQLWAQARSFMSD